MASETKTKKRFEIEVRDREGLRTCMMEHMFMQILTSGVMLVFGLMLIACDSVLFGAICVAGSIVSAGTINYHCVKCTLTKTKYVVLKDNINAITREKIAILTAKRNEDVDEELAHLDEYEKSLRAFGNVKIVKKELESVERRREMLKNLKK